MADVVGIQEKNVREIRSTAQHIVTTETLDTDDWGLIPWHPHFVRKPDLGLQGLGDDGGCTVGIQEKISATSVSTIYLHLQNLSAHCTAVTNAATAEEAPVTNSTINSDTVSITASPKPDLHTSSLAHLRPGQIQVLDPHTQLCRFELLGKCNDDQCPFQHYSPKERQNSDISKL